MNQILSNAARALTAILPKKAPGNLAPSAVAPAKKTADEIPTVALVAWQSPVKNTRLLIAYKPGTDPTNPNNLVSVNVRSNVNFMRFMTIRAKQVDRTSYDLVGPLPRWKGRM